MFEAKSVSVQSYLNLRILDLRFSRLIAALTEDTEFSGLLLEIHFSLQDFQGRETSSKPIQLGHFFLKDHAHSDHSITLLVSSVKPTALKISHNHSSCI